jgi:hypothetical protein
VRKCVELFQIFTVNFTFRSRTRRACCTFSLARCGSSSRSSGSRLTPHLSRYPSLPWLPNPVLVTLRTLATHPYPSYPLHPGYPQQPWLPTPIMAILPTTLATLRNPDYPLLPWLLSALSWLPTPYPGYFRYHGYPPQPWLPSATLATLSYPGYPSIPYLSTPFLATSAVLHYLVTLCYVGYLLVCWLFFATLAVMAAFRCFGFLLLSSLLLQKTAYTRLCYLQQLSKNWLPSTVNYTVSLLQQYPIQLYHLLVIYCNFYLEISSL